MVKWVPIKHIHHQRVQELLEESIQSNQFTNGSPVVQKLEQHTRTILGIDSSKAVVCVSNGTVALWATVAALELYYDRPLKFITQSFTFPASAQGYLSGVKIVDNDNEGGIDLTLVDQETCDGIIVTNIFGHLVNINKYVIWAEQHKKFLLFDNAATPFSFYKGSNSCNYGTAATLSFHHTKPIGFGEGGAIIIDSKYERSLRNIMNFGLDNSALNSKWHRFGGNYKMSDLQAVYILQYLENFTSIFKHVTGLYSYFKTTIQQYSNIQLFPTFSDDMPFISCICIFMRNSKIAMDLLLANNIYCRKYYNPLLPTFNAMKFFDTIVCIPCNTDMTIADIDTIVNLLKSVG